MSARTAKSAFATRPASPDQWIRTPDTHVPREGVEAFTARLTIDVTPALRGRIKIAAFQRGETAADMLRALLAREFPVSNGDAA